MTPSQMMRTLWFQVHWLLGITAGLVLAVVGVTGATLSFENELLLWMNPGVMSVTPKNQARLSPPEILTRIQARHPAQRITSFTVWANPERAIRIVFAPQGEDKEAPGARRRDTRYADPYTGELLGEARGAEFFRQTRQIHRWLAAGDVGKHIVGASTIALIVLCLSGLYLRWPRRLLDWRAWLTFNTALKGRSFLVALHKVTGTWVLLPFLLMGMTGLYWSYPWYRDALFTLTGAPRPVRSAPAPKDAARQKPDGNTAARVARGTSNIDMPAIWSVFEAEVGTFGSATVRLPQRPKQPVQINYLDRAAAHDRAYNRLMLNPVSADVVKHERYAEKRTGGKLMSSMFALHSGSFFGMPGVLALMLASLSMPLFAITGWMLYLGRRGRKRAVRDARPSRAPLASATPPAAHR